MHSLVCVERAAGYRRLSLAPDLGDEALPVLQDDVTNGDTRHSLSFSRAQRLAHSAEFLRVKSEGRAHRGALMILGILTLENEEPTGFRAGFVTSRRVGDAVVRNLLRRRLREIVRRHQRALRSGIWIVIIARPAAAGASYGALEDEWLRLAKRAFILAP